ncbi:unnamed protein product [Adineta steineri]|uniref:Uncharacterized protein n=1 Tax=Adineta steineri TaxID=433720 RepID=A0A818PK94_9BILA|nr:unnamed protein product [Adineta steineri]
MHDSLDHGLPDLWSVDSIAIDDFHCKIPTCRDFYYGLKDRPRRKEYEQICLDTVFALQAIPRNMGKCIHDDTGKLNKPCIYQLARTIKSCIKRMYDLPEKDARFYCGYTLMKYCAVHLGLEGVPLNFI